MEEKGTRTKLSLVLIIAAALVTVGIIAFLLMRLVRNNPLAGSWYNEEQNISAEFDDEGLLVISAEEGGAEAYQLEFNYKMDKESKFLDLTLIKGTKSDLISLTDKVLDSNHYDDSQLTLDTQYEYSITGNELTLMEREYGETIRFIRK